MKLKGAMERARRAAALAVRDPESTAAAAIALDRFRRSSEFLVGDAILEERVAPAVVDAHDSIDAVAIYGFADHIRLLLVVRVEGCPFEVLCALKPAGCSWGPEYQLRFDLDVVRWTYVGPGKFAFSLAKSAITAVIPFGSIVNALGKLAVDRAVRDMGLATAARWEGLTERGVTVDGSKATVDLRVQPELALLWSNPIDDHVGLKRILTDVVDIPTEVSEWFAIRDMRADREGLHLKAELTPACHRVFEVTAGLFRRKPADQSPS